MKKRIKRKLSKGLPQNYTFWCQTIDRPDELTEFIRRGNKKQKDSIRLVLQYMKRTDPDKFKDVAGHKILKRLNEKKK